MRAHPSPVPLALVLLLAACGGGDGGGGNTVTGPDAALSVRKLELSPSTPIGTLCRAYAAGEAFRATVDHDMASPQSATLSADLLGDGDAIIGAPNGGTVRIGTGPQTTPVTRPLRTAVTRDEVKAVELSIRTDQSQTARVRVAC